MRSVVRATGLLFLGILCAGAPASPVPSEPATVQLPPAEAAQRYAQALRSDPEHRPSLLGLARALLELDRPADSLHVARRLRALEPDDATVHLLLAGASARLPAPRRADIHEGLDSAEAALEGLPESPAAWHLYSVLLHMDGEYAAAVAAARRAVELNALNPTDPETTALYHQQEISCTDALLVFSPLD